MLENFINSISWPMVAPEAYGLFHISFTLIGFSLCGAVARRLRHVSDKNARRILFSCGLVLAISEVIKQVFCFYVIGNGSYHWGEFPFQLCSIPMYLCLIVPFMKQSRLRRAMYNFMVLYNLLGGAISFTEPSGLFHEYVFLTVHSCLWHMLLVFIGLFVCMSKRGATEKEDYGTATSLFIFLCEIAFLMNWFVQSVLQEHMNMFFVGPGNSPIIVFKQISEQFGWYINTPIYMCAVSLGAYLVFVLIYWIQHNELPSSNK